MKKVLGIVLVTLVYTIDSFGGGIRIDLNKSDLYKLELKTEHNVFQEINGRNHSMLTEVSSILAMQLVEKNDDYQKLRVTYEKMDILIESDYYVIEMKTSKRKENEDIMDCIVKKIINSPFYIEMYSNGEINVKGISKICTRALDSIEYLDTKAKENLKNTLEEVIGKKALQSNLALVTDIFPKNDVKVGDVWEKTTEQSVTSDIKNNYKLEEINDNIFTIKLNADIDSTRMQKEEPVNVLLSGKQSGKIKIDENTGWIVEGKISKKLSGSVVINKCEEYPNGLKYPVQYITSISFRSLD